MRTLRLAVFFALAMLGAVAGLKAQTGAIEGTVWDPSGAQIAGAALHITEASTSAERDTVTNRMGHFAALGLVPGSYTIQVTCEGFKTQLRKGLTLPAGRTIRLDFTLELGELSDQVVVEASAPLVSASVADWGSRIEEEDLGSLPLNGRDAFELAGLEAGANISLIADRGLTGGFGIQIAVNGARPNRNSFQMDGVYINDSSSSVPVSSSGQQLGLESIRELHVVTSPYSAEYGQVGGAAFTAVSKSGTNQLHGSLYEYFRNSALDARNYFDAPGEPIPQLRRNQFGGMIGGPLVRDKMFFLANYEAVRANLGSTTRSEVPTAAAREGLLPVEGGGTKQVSVVPEVVPYLSVFPMPNGVDFGDGTAEFVAQRTLKTRDDYVSGKVDVLFTPAWRLAGRYTFDDGETTEPDPLHVMTFAHDSRYSFIHADLQRIHSPTTIFNIRGGMSRVRNDEIRRISSRIPDDLEFVPGRGLGSLRVSGLSDVGGSIADGRPRGATNTNYQLNGDLTHNSGRHTIRAGAGFDRIHYDQTYARGFTGQYRFGSLEDFLLGQTRTAQVATLDSDAYRRWRNEQYHAYIQGELRLTPSLHLSLGIRYETATVPDELDGKSAALRDPLNDEGVTVGPLYRNPSLRNFAPRAALAWDPFGSGTTVIRAGGGIFYQLLGSRQLAITGTRYPPFYRRLSLDEPVFPDLVRAIEGADTPGEINGIEYDMMQPYLGRWQFSIEQQLTSNQAVRISYSGARGVHLLGYVDNLNMTTPQYLPDGRIYFAPGAPLLNPALDGVGMRRPLFNSFYHGVSVAFEGNLWRDLRLQTNYTFAKSIDESSADVSTEFANSSKVPTGANYRLNRGLSDYDLRHVLTSNFSYRAPGPEAGLGEKILGGWEIHGILQVQSGSPFSPEVGFDRSNLGPDGSEPGQRPDLAMPGVDLILGDPGQWFNPLGFSLQAEGFYGTAGRNVLAGPGLASLNLGIRKDLWRTDRHRVGFRAEFFNITNHPNFQIPSDFELFNSRGQRNNSAGRITSTSTTSRQVQLAVRWEF